MVVNILISVASAHPYVQAALFVRAVIDKVAGVSDSLKRQYQILTYSGMVDTLQDLLDWEIERKGGFYYSRTGNLDRYLTHVAQLRILGEMKYQEFYSSGANGAFTDQEDLKVQVERSIGNIRFYAQMLRLTLKV